MLQDVTGIYVQNAVDCCNVPPNQVFFFGNSQLLSAKVFVQIACLYTITLACPLCKTTI